MEKLKPCPFCGGEAKLKMEHKPGIGLTLWCECESCGAEATGYCPQDNIDSFDKSRELALEKWNRRAEK